MKLMLLKKLIKNCPEKFSNIKISGLSLNSKDIKPGYIFFAKKGYNKNGSDYALDALNRGARVIISENLIGHILLNDLLNNYELFFSSFKFLIYQIFF